MGNQKYVIVEFFCYSTVKLLNPAIDTVPPPPGGEGWVLPYKGLMGTCGQPGYVFRDFCLKQGIDFIVSCLNQGIDFIKSHNSHYGS